MTDKQSAEDALTEEERAKEALVKSLCTILDKRAPSAAIGTTRVDALCLLHSPAHRLEFERWEKDAKVGETRRDALRLFHSPAHHLEFGRWKKDAKSVEVLIQILKRARRVAGGLPEVAGRSFNRNFRVSDILVSKLGTPPPEEPNNLTDWNVPLTALRALECLIEAAKAAQVADAAGEPVGTTDWAALASLSECFDIYQKRTGKNPPRSISKILDYEDQRGPFFRFAKYAMRALGHQQEISWLYDRLWEVRDYEEACRPKLVPRRGQTSIRAG